MLAVVLVPAGIGLGWFFAGRGNAGGYVAHNKGILRALKAPPQARVLLTASTPSADGYETAEYVRVRPAVSREALIRHYRSMLSEWNCRQSRLSGRFVVNCLRGSSWVGLYFTTLASKPATYYVNVDANGSRRRH